MSPLKTRTIVLLAAFASLGFLLGRSCRSAVDMADSVDETRPAAAAARAEPTVWTCSMHPQVRLLEPGQCPICFMDLIPLADDDGDGDEQLGPRALRMTEAAMRLAEVETAPVRRMSVAHEVSMVGKVAFDETRVSYLTAWVGGRLDRLFVDYTGVTVRKGDHMVEIYSPVLYAAQQELLQSIVSAKRLETSSLDILRSTGDATVLSAREKLRLYGLSEGQIQEVVERGSADEHVVLYAPGQGIVVHKNALEGMYVEQGTRIYTIADLTKLWVLLDAYESDLAWLRYGQDVTFGVEAFGGETFHGRIAFIDPVLNDRTRTVKVRLNIDNADQRLKPDMFVSATVQAVLTPGGQVVDEELADKWMCPMHPEVLADGPASCPECGMDLVQARELGFVTRPERGPSLVIPATAPLITGKRAVVYVRLPDRERPTFEGRVIDLGPRAGDWYVVEGGLDEGEQVVVKGNFKIDSELQIRAKPSMMSPEGGAPAPGHRHGEASPPGQSDRAPAQEREAVEAPAAFRKQLGEVADVYLRLQGALALDADEPAAAAEIPGALERVDMALLHGPAHGRWMELMPALRESAQELASAKGLDERRARLAPLTARLVRALEAFGYERADGDLGVFHCPMALDGEGADWLQVGDQTMNPYYGSAMLRCGTRTRVLGEER